MRGPEKLSVSLFYYTARMTVLVGAKIWLRFRAFGAENVPDRGGCIIAANHVSYLDPPLVACGVGHRVVRFIARDTLLSTRLGKWFFKGIRTVPIDRAKGDVGALRQALQVLKGGEAIGLFPEGTRSANGQMQPAKGGIGFLIAKAKVPVVPAYVDGTFEVFPKGASRIKRGRTSVFYGKPILPAELEHLGTGRDAYDAISHLVMSKIAELRHVTPS